MSLPLSQFGSFTPHMVVNDRATVVGNYLAKIDALIADATPLAGPTLALDAATLTIGASTTPSAGADMWRVSYDPHTVQIPVNRSENAGHTLAHTHVVHDLEHLGRWPGASTQFYMASPADGLHTAILVQ